MGTIMHYCSICGNLLELNDTYQVVAQDWETRKTKKLYETCKLCFGQIENRKYAPMKLSKRSKPKFTSIIKKWYENGRQKSKLLF